MAQRESGEKMSEPLIIGTSLEASAGLMTAGEKVLLLHKLISSDLDDAEFRRAVGKVLGPKP